MSFDNWNKFLQEQLSALNRERTEGKFRKEPGISEEFNSESVPKVITSSTREP